MRRSRRHILAPVALTALTAVLGGCGSSLVGTWESERSREQIANVQFDFAAVTFAPDGTYTAEMIYAGRSLSESGTWDHEASELIVGPPPTRRYGVIFRDKNTVSFAAPEGTVTMTRYRP